MLELPRLPPNPVHDQFNLLRLEFAISSVTGHSIVFLSVETTVLGVFDKRNQPVPRTVARQVRGRSFVFGIDVMTINAGSSVFEEPIVIVKEGEQFLPFVFFQRSFIGKFRLVCEELGDFR